MDIEEFVEYLEFRDPKIRQHIQKSSEENMSGKSRPADEFLQELRLRGVGQ